MRRLVVAESLAALGLSLVVPMASAHNDASEHRFAWGASPNPSTANDRAQVYSNDEVVAAAVEFIDGVKSWDVVIRPVNGGAPSTCHEDIAQLNGKYPQKIYINCPWDTTRATNHTLPGSTAAADAQRAEFSRTWQSQDLGPSVNGKYTVEVTAYNSGQDYNCGLITGCKRLPVEPHSLYQSGSDPPRWRELWVVNGVSEPTGVTNSFNPANNKITVSWAPNPEPDVSYMVQEKVGDGKWSGGAPVPGNATSYERVIEQPGQYQYRVGAVRAAPTSENASATKKSEYVATSAVDIAQVTPPTTAGSNGADGAVDGGDPGVFLPSDPASPSAPAGPRASAPPKGTQASGRSGGLVTGSRPSGSSSRPTGSTAPFSEAEEIDEGFSPTLDYGQAGGDDEMTEEELAGGEDQPQSMMPGVTVPRPRDTRALLIPLALGLLVFVMAMQMMFVLRRRPAMATVDDDDFGDWMGY